MGSSLVCRDPLGALAVRATPLLRRQPCHSPSNTNAAGPRHPQRAGRALATGSRARRRASATRTSASSLPRRRSTATAAQAPLPQARVSPTPRSHTRRRIASRASTCAKPTLQPCGKRAARARSARRAPRPAPARRRRPRPPHADCPSTPRRSRRRGRRRRSCSAQRAASIARSSTTSGICAGSKRGSPMSARTLAVRRAARPRPARTDFPAASGPAPARRRVPASAPRSAGHCRTGRERVPSVFQIAYAKAQDGSRAGSMVSNWSKPTPKWRSPSRADRGRVECQRRARGNRR